MSLPSSSRPLSIDVNTSLTSFSSTKSNTKLQNVKSNRSSGNSSQNLSSLTACKKSPITSNFEAGLNSLRHFQPHIVARRTKVHSNNDKSSIHSKSNEVLMLPIGNEKVAKKNDLVIQERLIEAKAMGTKQGSGAIIHKFSLWNTLDKNKVNSFEGNDSNKIENIQGDGSSGFISSLRNKVDEANKIDAIDSVVVHNTNPLRESINSNKTLDLEEEEFNDDNYAIVFEEFDQNFSLHQGEIFHDQSRIRSSSLPLLDEKQTPIKTQSVKVSNIPMDISQLSQSPKISASSKMRLTPLSSSSSKSTTKTYSATKMPSFNKSANNNPIPILSNQFISPSKSFDGVFGTSPPKVTKAKSLKVKHLSSTAPIKSDIMTSDNKSQPVIAFPTPRLHASPKLASRKDIKSSTEKESNNTVVEVLPDPRSETLTPPKNTSPKISSPKTLSPKNIKSSNPLGIEVGDSPSGYSQDEFDLTTPTLSIMTHNSDDMNDEELPLVIQQQEEIPITNSKVITKMPIIHDIPNNIDLNQSGDYNGYVSIIFNGINGDSSLRWKKGQPIGEGSFGTVFKGLNQQTGELVAVKQLGIGGGSAREIEIIEREIQVMWQLDHENIVRYLGTSKTEKYFFIVLEYVSGGSISSMLSQFGAFSESLIRKFSCHIINGVDYLHNKGIIHRDIKSANVLVTQTGIVKIADFGTSKKIAGLCSTHLEESLRIMRGSVLWMAPEVVREQGFGKYSDIWSVGATILEMATGKPPWNDFTDNLAALYHIATTQVPPEIPSHLSMPCFHFISKCLVIDPSKRITAKELLCSDEFLGSELKQQQLSKPSTVYV